MKQIRKALMASAVVAALLGVGSTLLAAPITGDIGFKGEFAQNGGTMGDLGTATSFSVINPSIGSSHGSFAGATLVSFASIINVNPGAGLISLWQVQVGSVNYSFSLTSEVQDFTTATSIHLVGAGVLSNGNPVDTITGVWQLGFGASGQAFEWQCTSAATQNPLLELDAIAVPEAGPTAGLVGAGICLLGFFRRQALARRS